MNDDRGFEAVMQEASATAGKVEGAIKGMTSGDANLGAAAVIDLAASITKLVKDSLITVLSLASFSVEVFLRMRFGERYFTLTRCFFTLFFLGALSDFNNVRVFFATDAREKSIFQLGTLLMAFTILAYQVMCLLHGVAIFVRRQRRVRVHSRYTGDSVFFPPMLPFFDTLGGQRGFQMVVEPVIVIAAGFIFAQHPFTSPLMPWLVVSGVALFLKGYLEDRRLNEEVLNMIDNQIKSEVLQKLCSEWKETSSIATKGYAVPHALKSATPQERVVFATTSASLHPDLQALIGGAPATRDAPSPG